MPTLGGSRGSRVRSSPLSVSVIRSSLTGDDAIRTRWPTRVPRARSRRLSGRSAAPACPGGSSRESRRSLPRRAGPSPRPRPSARSRSGAGIAFVIGALPPLLPVEALLVAVVPVVGARPRQDGAADVRVRKRWGARAGAGGWARQSRHGDHGDDQRAHPLRPPRPAPPCATSNYGTSNGGNHIDVVGRATEHPRRE